jgi:hypothetical protein
MDDERIWTFETGLWTGDTEHYRQSIDDACLMVLPTSPFIMVGNAAIEAVSKTPRWTQINLSQRKVSRPQDGLIVVAYFAEASIGEDEKYTAYCTSTYRRRGHDNWTVIQHQQTPPLATN